MHALSFQNIRLDVLSRTLLRDGQPARLEPKAMDLLLLLLQHRERCLTKEEIVRALWPDTHVSSSSLPRLIKELRRALGDDAESPRIVRTLHGRGYQFVAQVRSGCPAAPAEPSRRLPRADEIYLGSRMQQLLPPLRHAAAAAISILIEGETGTGKRTLARLIHLWSGRAELRVLSCPGLSEGELSEQFPSSEPAHAALAATWTVILDEAGELEPDAQRWLLRRLDARTGLKTLQDEVPAVRLICTSKQPLRELAVRGRLRSDLYARLAGFTVRVPPLRERPDEIAALVDHFASKHAAGQSIAFTPEALESLREQAWPFNLYELESLVRAIVWTHQEFPLEVSASILYALLSSAPPDG